MEGSSSRTCVSSRSPFPSIKEAALRWSKFMLLCATPVVDNTGLTRAFERSRHFIEIRSLKKKSFPKVDLDRWIPSKYKKLGSKTEVGFMIFRATSNLRFFRDFGAGGLDSLPFLLSRTPGFLEPSSVEGFGTFVCVCATNLCWPNTRYHKGVRQNNIAAFMKSIYHDNLHKGHPI